MKRLLLLAIPLFTFLTFMSCETMVCEEPPEEAAQEFTESIVIEGAEMEIPETMQAEVIRLDDGTAQLKVSPKDGNGKTFTLFVCQCVSGEGTCDIAASGFNIACVTGFQPCANCEFVEVTGGFGGK